MKRILRIAFFALVVLFIVLGMCMMVIAYAGAFLQKADAPEEASAIVVLAGAPVRAIYASDLYLKGYAREVYVSKPAPLPGDIHVRSLGVPVPLAEEVYRQILLQKGVSQRHIHLFGNDSVSTYDEAMAAYKIFGHSPSCHFLIVTSPYHVARARMIFSDVFHECRIRVIKTPYEEFQKKWWTTQNSAVEVILEIIKIVFYKMGGRFGKRT